MSETEYSILRTDEESSVSSSADAVEKSRAGYFKKSLSKTFWLLTLLNVALFVTSLYLILLHGFSHRRQDDPNYLLRQTSAYCEPLPSTFELNSYSLTLPAPMFDKLSIPFKHTTVNGTLWPAHPPSPYQLPPSPSVDAAWDRLANVYTVPFTRAEIASTGKDPSKTVTYPPHWNLSLPNPDSTLTPNGDDDDHDDHDKEPLHIGLLSVFHQIHCLNALRKALDYDYYYSTTYNNTSGLPLTLEAHVRHCTYYLLQTLTCHSDLEINTFQWREGSRGMWPDFAVERKCRDFEKVLEWQERNMVDERKVEEGEWEGFKLEWAMGHGQRVVEQDDVPDLELYRGEEGGRRGRFGGRMGSLRQGGV
ncbi:MAG: hypothetical protein Q9227_005150 [Pyrenula ochraceoflavens]